MRLERIMHIYGDKPPLYAISSFILFFTLGWLTAQYGNLELEGIAVRALGLFIVVYFLDAIVKSILFAGKNFNISITPK
jgi:hypothetical protein